MAGEQTSTAVPTTNLYQGIGWTIEVATRQNNHLACPITKRQYRGRWEMTNVKNRVPDDRFANCPVIPGINIVFDGSRLSVSILDPLGFRENKELLKEARSVVKAQWGIEPDPDEPAKFEKLPADKLKQWNYWARRWLDCGYVELKAGSVPSMEEIDSLPGRVERNTFGVSAQREKFPNESDTPQYVPPPKVKAGST